MFLVDGSASWCWCVIGSDGGRCVPRLWECLLVLVGDSPDGGRCVPRRWAVLGVGG